MTVVSRQNSYGCASVTTIATLFSGGGGCEIGATDAGMTPLWAVENDREIAAVYTANIGPHVLVTGVAEIDYSVLPAPDLLHASPVCTSFSQAKTNGGETNADIDSAQAVCRAIRTLQPRWFTLENVIGYRRSMSYRRICSTLTDLGYMWRDETVNAADHGVPQTRRRLILRASRDGMLRSLPVPVPWNGWYSAVEDLIPQLPESRFAPWQIARLKQAAMSHAFLIGGANTSEGKSGPGVGVSEAHEPTRCVNTSNSMRWRAYLCDTSNAGRDPTVLDEHTPSMTIQAWHGRRPSHMPVSWLSSGRVVGMTPRTLARFQSVPDAYILPPRAGFACKIVGNMVPPVLMRRIVESLG